MLVRSSFRYLTQTLRKPLFPASKLSGFHPRRRAGRGTVFLLERLEDRTLLSAASLQDGELSVARLWNEELLDAIRVDTPRPTIHARNLFHVSVAMYDAWAAYDDTAVPYVHLESAAAEDTQAAQEEAISFAAYRVLSARFANSPGAETSLESFDTLMESLGYDPTFTSTIGDSPAALGNRAAQTVLTVGIQDGSNEAHNYADTTGYQPVNPPLVVTESGATLIDPNLWQPLVVAGTTQKFLTPHWGDVVPFAMTRASAEDVYVDPGAPPQLRGAGDADFRAAVVEVIRYSSRLDPGSGVLIDISPASNGNNPLGTNDGTGHELNPYTGQPYEEQLVQEADWGRVLAEFWADGPNSETPPGHWNTIANDVSDTMDALGIEKRIGGSGPVVDELEWDVKLYLALNGAVHDAAIAAWDAKEAYDYVRPISMIRYMGGLGQSSDPAGPSYHEHGLPLEPGLIEVITPESSAAGERHAHLADQVGEVAIFAWAGHPENPDGVGGVEWILAENWLPYQAENFVTPPFAAYVSGHSTFSRASAEVLTFFTGNEYFPGGLGTYTAEAGNFLKFEGGPSELVELQWATYYDAADEAGLSRLYGGIHVAADDFAGRIMGSQIGIAAFEQAQEFSDPDPDVVVTAPQGNGADLFTLRRNGEFLELVNQRTGSVERRRLSATDSVTITGADFEADTLVIDFRSGGSFSVAEGIRFEGGQGGGDRLLIRGTAQADEISLIGATLQANDLSGNVAGVEQLRIEALGGNDTLQLAAVTLLGGAELDGGLGNDVYQLATHETQLLLRDAGGIDELDFSQAEEALRIHLKRDRGQLQRIGAGANELALDGTFENVIGTEFGDRIRGNDADNRLAGGGGKDHLFGKRGDDTLIGGAGKDRLHGGAGDDTLEQGDGASSETPGDGTDGVGPLRDRLLALTRFWRNLLR